jgi:hypothetical protein
MDSSQKDVVIRVSAATAVGSAPAPTLVLGVSHYAPDWFEDATREAVACNPGDWHARRREIIFAVNCAESYLVEWTGDLLSTKLRGAELHDALRDYFSKPAFGQRGQIVQRVTQELEDARGLLAENSVNVSAIASRLDAALDQFAAMERAGPPALTEKWLTIPRRLHADGYLTKAPRRYSTVHTREFAELVGYRNDITHADLSFPVVLAPTPAESREARTTTSRLAQLPPGWAVGVVAEGIRQLHRNTGAKAPEWVRSPASELV